MGRRKHGQGEGARPHLRKDGRYEAKITVDGKQHSIYGKSAAEVERKRRARLRDQARGLPLTGERQTVGQFAEKWLEERRLELGESTYRRYENLLRVHVLPTLGKVALAKLTPAHLRRLYGQRREAAVPGKPRLRASSSTLHRVHTLLHGMLQSAVGEGLVARNVCDLVDAPRDAHRETKTLSREEAQALLEALKGERLEALYVLALETGMRQGELLGLRWEDIDLSGGVARVAAAHAWRKGRKDAPTGPAAEEPRRTVTLSDAAVEALRQHRERQIEERRVLLGKAWEARGLVFCDEIGVALTGDSVRRTHFYGALARAGLPRVRFEELRKVFAPPREKQGERAAGERPKC